MVSLNRAVKAKANMNKAIMYLITCGILVLMHVILTCNPPKKAHCIIIDPMAILSGKKKKHN